MADSGSKDTRDGAASSGARGHGASQKAARRKSARKSRDMTWTVYTSLRESILNGVLAPGQSLSQVQLASELGVSRGPLREAVRIVQRQADRRYCFNKS